MGELRIKLLGTPRITLGDSPLTFQRRSAVALLAYLAMTRCAQSREVLATMLTGDVTDVQAKKHLRNALNDLSDQVGDYLAITRHSVAFNHHQPYWLDVDDFAYGARDNVVDASEWQLAADLYEGELLSGFGLRDASLFDEWLQRERQHYRGLYVQALHRLLERAAQRGDYSQGMRLATRLLTEEPWREETHRQLMLLLERTGQRSAALAQYEACRRAVAESLGSEPQAETTALYERLRAQPVLAVNLQPLAQRMWHGRIHEMPWLPRRRSDGPCRPVTIPGLDGNGKTCPAQQAVEHFAAMHGQNEQAFPDGVHLVDLSRVDDRVAADESDSAISERRVAEEIGRALGLDVQAHPNPIPRLTAYLRSKALLLVLDNAEHALAGRRVLENILRQAPRVKLLVASRERLQLPDASSPAPGNGNESVRPKRQCPEAARAASAGSRYRSVWRISTRAPYFRARRAVSLAHHCA